jgi:nucleoside recognition membrane protein YjiH
MTTASDNTEHQSRPEPSRLPPRLRFLLPSLVGIALFLLPVTINGKSTILLGYITDLIKLPLQPYAITIVASIVTLAALGGGYYLLARPDWKESHPTLYAFCYVEPVWFCVRLVGAMVCCLNSQDGPQSTPPPPSYPPVWWA